MLNDVLRQQSAFGGFPSFIDAGGEIIEDENCFITSLVLLELLEYVRRNGDNKEIWEAIEKGAQFIENCEQPDRKGRFYFYPLTIDSPRLPIAIDADYDDSALALSVLLCAGKRQLKDIQDIIIELFEPGKIKLITGQDAAWVKPSLFRTWIVPRAAYNPADCCVNLNILSFYAAAGMLGYHNNVSITQHIEYAVTLFGTGLSAMRRIAPYYAHPAELFFCLDRVARSGIKEVDGLLQKVRKNICSEFGDNVFLKADRPICCNAHGRPLWFAPVLQLARAENQSIKNN